MLNIQIKLVALATLFDVPATRSLKINEYINDTALDDTSV
mgnify:FL=1|jgi:hypothetical protein